MRFAAVLLASLSLAFSPPQDGDVGGEAAKKDRELMQGAWSVVTLQVGTMEVLSPGGEHSVTFEKGKMWITRDGKKFPEGTAFRLDATKSPRCFDLEIGNKMERKGIYELKDNTLILCYGVERPTRFDANEQAAGPYNVLYILNRK